LNVSIDVEGGITGAVLGLVLSGEVENYIIESQETDSQEALADSPLSNGRRAPNWLRIRPTVSRKQYRKELNQMVCPAI